MSGDVPAPLVIAGDPISACPEEGVEILNMVLGSSSGIHVGLRREIRLVEGKKMLAA